MHELQFLETHYGIMMTADIAAQLGRTLVAIRLAARQLGCSQEQNGPWTDEEKAIIHTHYADGRGIAYVSQLLPGRKRKTIFAMARELGVKSARNWQPYECQILTEYYPDIGVKVAEKLPGRTADAVKIKAMALGVKYRGKAEGEIRLVKWSDEEWRLLEKNLHLPYPELVMLFPHRSQDALEKAKARLKKRIAKR
ncbi:hypothetical protein CRN84_21470 [Budvicia aquatica]|uniref:Uncharacterized protein n=1 Tax=Budvicia aquatica TaxID=82979 RepID=A0A2C6DNH5_9GAMM|nr:hypothetical protein CRN84_21470 [Budvicia aquatica]